MAGNVACYGRRRTGDSRRGHHTPTTHAGPRCLTIGLVRPLRLRLRMDGRIPRLPAHTGAESKHNTLACLGFALLSVVLRFPLGRIVTEMQRIFCVRVWLHEKGISRSLGPSHALIPSVIPPITVPSAAGAEPCERLHGDCRAVHASRLQGLPFASTAARPSARSRARGSLRGTGEKQQRVRSPPKAGRCRRQGFHRLRQPRKRSSYGPCSG